MHALKRPLFATVGPLVVLAVLAAVLAARARSGPGPARVEHAAKAPAAPGRAPSTVPEPVRAPEESLRLFTLDERFTIGIATAEPMIEAPVVLNFDEDGRAWVVEMRGYMPNAEGKGEDVPNGRISILEDTDRDGVFDRRTLFLDKLVVPRAVLPVHGGALVLEPPNLYFCRDTDGDGRADEKKRLVGGLGGENPEHAPNALTYGMDNWVHLSQSPIELKFDGENIVTRKTPNHGQWGLAQDEFGRLYYTPNSEALRADFYPKHYASRNSGLRETPGLNELIVSDQAVFPVRPTTGVNRGYMSGILRDDGTLAVHTAACGTTIYDASLFPADFRGNAFVCEPAGLLVRRLLLDERDGLVRGRSATPGREFLASTDERFRPVHACVGPDGSLFILDMHRGVIQHKTYLTDYLKQQVAARKLELPLDMGRIYRIAPKGTKVGSVEKLSGVSDARLVELLASPDAWHRRAAQRLLVERRATGVVPALRALTSGPATPVRLHALWTLEGLSALTVEDALSACADADPHIRAAGARLAEPWLKDDATRVRVLTTYHRLLGDRTRFVHRQAILSAGEAPGVASFETLMAASAAPPADRIDRSLIISGLGGREAEFIRSSALRDWYSSQPWRVIMVECAQSALRASPQSRTALIEAIGEIAKLDRWRARMILQQVRGAQQVDSDAPKVLRLTRQPAGYDELLLGGDELASEARDSLWYLDWPGRPAVTPPKRMRAMTAIEQQRFNVGQGLFSVCAGCHGSEGQGISGQIPALSGSARVQGPSGRAIRILLHGLEGPQEAVELGLPGAMPPAPFRTDDDIAAVLTYIRRAWGNSGDPVAPVDVAAIRAQTAGRDKPWTVEELNAIK